MRPIGYERCDKNVNSIGLVLKSQIRVMKANSGTLLNQLQEMESEESKVASGCKGPKPMV